MEVLTLATQAPERTKSRRISPQPIFPKIRLNLLPILALNDYFDLDRILAAREVSAAIINLSGRQRMLSQRAALSALRLTVDREIKERETQRENLLAIVDLMEQLHCGLIEGDSQLKLPGNPSFAIQEIHENSPYNLDRKMADFLRAGRAIAQADRAELTLDNPDLQYILQASEKDLLEALDAAVAQYQKEQEEQELALDLYQAQLYQESCTAIAVAQVRTQELSQTLIELQNTQGQLIQAEKLSDLGQLIAGVAHEINNPLGFIDGNLNYAENHVTDLLSLLDSYSQHYPQPAREIRELAEDIEFEFIRDDLPKLLSSMKMGAERIQDIVLSLRNFSRSDNAKPQLIDLHECIESTLIILRYRFKHSCQNGEIKIIKDYDRLPPVECYPGQLNQALMNILSNAIDALEEAVEQPTIIIRTELIESNPKSNICSSKQKWVAVRIADNGMGIPEEVRQNLFKPFFTTKPVGKGTGLGLSIGNQIVVDRHRGNLECRSQLGQGTEFSIEIPIQQTF
jgi:two-component system, NtrC family, sensor kinase